MTFHHITNIKGPSGPYGVTNLGAGVDLDTVTTPGAYIQSRNTDASAALNYPGASAGLLEVYSNTYFVFQRYMRFETPTQLPFTWVRTRYASQWSPWRRYAFEATA